MEAFQQLSGSKQKLAQVGFWSGAGEMKGPFPSPVPSLHSVCAFWQKQT